jgi:proteasome activator subunit 4
MSLTADKKDEKLVADRLKHYALDYPDDYEEYKKKILDNQSKWFSRSKARHLNLPEELPYSTETHKDQARYLSHVLVHLYIAIKSMDLEGYVRISTKDLAAVKNDIELTLDTDFFNADMTFEVEEQDGEEADDEDDEVKSSGVIGKVLPRSATIVSVNHWTNELKSCLKMKFDIPLTLRSSLAKVYYFLCLSRGQSIHLSMFIDIFVKLTQKYQDDLVENKLLELDHIQLLDFYTQFFADPSSNYEIYNPQVSESDKETFNLMLKLSLHSNPFFKPGSIPEIFEWSIRRFHVRTAYLCTPILSRTLPAHFNGDESVMSYINAIFYLWTNLSPNKTRPESNYFYLLNRISQKAYKLISAGKLSHEKLPKFGILTDLQMDFILNRIQRNLRTEFQDQSYSKVAGLLVSSITPQNFDDLFKKLKTLLNSLETFVHPSNFGSWSTLIAKFCHRFVFTYHERVMAEKEKDCELPDDLKLTKGMNGKIVDAFSDLVLLGSQAKKDSISNYYVSTIGYLGDIAASCNSLFTDKILLDVYDSLTDQFIDSSHRIIVSLKQFTELSRFIVYDPIYRIHIVQLLNLMINKIGTNDLNLSNHVMNTFVSLTSIIPIQIIATDADFVSFESTALNFIQEHLQFIKMYPGEGYQPSRDDINAAFKASTMGFRDMVRLFTERLFLLLEADLDEKFNFKVTQVVLIFTESLSDELFREMADLVHNQLLEGGFEEITHNAPIFANIVASMVRRDNSLAKKFFSDLERLIRFEIEQGAGSVRNNTAYVLDSDMKLELYLIIISEVISVSNEKLVEFHKQVLKLIKLVHEKITNPSLASVTSYVVHKTLKNLSNIKIKENRLLKNQPTLENYSAAWGGHQFDEKRFNKENLDFEWYVPTITEVRCAIDIFESVILMCLTKVDEIIGRQSEPDLPVIDELIKNFAFLGTALSGISILFDPDFNNSADDHNFDNTSLAHRLLILRSLRSSKSDGHELNIDIEQITEKDDDPDVLPDATIPDANAIDIPVQAQDPADMSNFDGEFMVFEDEIASSRLLTPSDDHESDLTSVMNPSIAFRKGKIYSCNYFFGSTATEKKNSFDYNHLHSLRNIVAQELHKIFLFLKSQKSENVNLFQPFLILLKTYFSDVGKESSYDVDDQLFIDYTFLKRVQSMGNYKKPFTRTTLGARIEKYHRQRVILHSTNRFPSKLDKILLSDLMELATSAYETTSNAAFSALTQTMRKIIGSYSLILKSLLAQAVEYLASNNYKRLESTLKMFLLSKVANKIGGDYKNLKDIISMFDKCAKCGNHEVSRLAKNLLIAKSDSIKVPSAVAIFNESGIDSAIRPPDKCIDLEINAVRTAKDKRREEYIKQLEELQELMLTLTHENSHWQHTFAYLNYLTNLQEYFEIKTSPDVLKLLATQAKGHPSLVRHCLKWFSKMVDKVMHLATYGYDLRSTFELNYLRPGMVEIDTSDDFQVKFEAEMKNFEKPNFFFDGRMSSGWLFWGKSLVALTTEKSFEFITLSKEDTASLAEFGSIIEKKWLSDVLKSVTIDNESKAVFQVSDVSLVVAVIQLLEFGFTPITYQDILDILDDIYDKEDKASIILAAEIVCALFIATIHTREENIALRDTYLDKFLDRILLSDLNPESSGVWSIVCWWIPSKIDFRRVPLLHKKLMNLDSIVDPSQNALIQSSHLLLTRSYISNLGWELQNPEDILLSLDFAHPYRAVRFQMGGLLAVLSIAVCHESFSSCKEFLKAQESQELGAISFQHPPIFDEQIKKLFGEIESKRAEIESMTAQDAMNSDYYYLSTSMLAWLLNAKTSPFVQEIIPYVKDYLIPMVMHLDSYRDLCKLGQIELEPVLRDFAKNIRYRPEQLADILEITTYPYSSVHQLRHQLTFIENLFSRQLLILSPEQKVQLISRVDELLFHSSVEVRSKAADVLAGIIHNSKDLDTIDQFVERYKNILSKRGNKKQMSNEKLIKLHGAAIGLGALISAFPYTSPPPEWMPDQIVALARASSYPGVVGKSAKDILSNFKKLRADTWHIDRQSFTESQLEDLEGVLWRSYFA